MQFYANTSRWRKGIDISLHNVGALGFRPPPPVGQVQQLESEKLAVERQVGSSVEVTQEVSAFASVGPLKRCGVTPLKDVVLQRQNVKHLLPSNPVVLEKGSTRQLETRRLHRPTRAARQGDNVIIVVRYGCVSLKVVEVVVAGPTVQSGDTSPVVESTVEDACEEPLCPR